MNIGLIISHIQGTIASLVVSCVMVFALGSAVLADPCDPIKIMTHNLFVGADFNPLLAAKTQTEFSQAVTTSYRAIVATKPAERMAAVARKIALLEPDFVGLQEAGILRTGTARPATKVEFDFVQILLAELSKLKRNYALVAVIQGLDAEAASTLGFNVRFTIQNVILARSDHPYCKFDFSNFRAQRYLAQHFILTPIGLVTNPSGWVGVDIAVANRRLRFVTTHLAITPNGNTTVPHSQAVEVMWTAGRTNLPTVLVGDFNTTANIGTDPTFVIYRSFVRAGYVDTWSRANPGDSGLTCCQPADLKNSGSLLSIRNDLILVRNGIRVVESQLVGNQQSDRTASGLWPSDHAGLVATLTFTGD